VPWNWKGGLPLNSNLITAPLAREEAYQKRGKNPLWDGNPAVAITEREKNAENLQKDENS